MCFITLILSIKSRQHFDFYLVSYIYKELKTLLKAHYDPKPLVIAERFLFYRRDQTAEESVSEFLVELRRLASHCEYGQFLDDALLDLRLTLRTQNR